jgi:hypothetical protein
LAFGCCFAASRRAERAKSSRPAELARRSSIARRSARELEYHLPLSGDLQFLPAFVHERLAADAEIKWTLTAPTQELSTDWFVYPLFSTRGYRNSWETRILAR